MNGKYRRLLVIVALLEMAWLTMDDEESGWSFEDEAMSVIRTLVEEQEPTIAGDGWAQSLTEASLAGVRLGNAHEHEHVLGKAALAFARFGAEALEMAVRWHDVELELDKGGEGGPDALLRVGLDSARLATLHSLMSSETLPFSKDNGKWADDGRTMARMADTCERLGANDLYSFVDGVAFVREKRSVLFDIAQRNVKKGLRMAQSASRNCFGSEFRMRIQRPSPVGSEGYRTITYQARAIALRAASGGVSTDWQMPYLEGFADGQKGHHPPASWMSSSSSSFVAGGGYRCGDQQSYGRHFKRSQLDVIQYGRGYAHGLERPGNSEVAAILASKFARDNHGGKAHDETIHAAVVAAGLAALFAVGGMSVMQAARTAADLVTPRALDRGHKMILAAVAVRLAAEHGRMDVWDEGALFFELVRASADEALEPTKSA